MSEAEDHALMLAVQNGRPEQLAVLFARHHRAVFNFFRKLGHATADAEDLLQETFIRILKYAQSYQSQKAFAPWLYRIARNTAHDAWQARGPELLEEAAAPEQCAPEVWQPDAELAQQELEQRLQRALQRLSRDKRELILLSRIKLLDIEALAGLYACSSNVIKVRLHRSLQELRRHFDKDSPLNNQEQE